MARFSISHHHWSEYGHINVSFSIVEEANYHETPVFSHGYGDFPKRLYGLSDLLITSQVGEADINEKGLVDSHYGFEVALDLDQPSLNGTLFTALSAGKRIQNRVAKLCETEGYTRNLAEYLRYVFRAMNVQYITHESYSEKHFNQKWRGYKLGDIPMIIERCTGELAECLRWQLPVDAAS